jgi:hypothetical protein
MPKGQKRQKNQVEDEEPEDIMAWGNRRDNYYQQSEEEYSQSDEEEQAAQELYERQLEHLGDQELYELPEGEDEEKGDAEEDEEEGKESENVLAKDYLTKEIARVAKLGLRLNEEADSKVRRIL